MSAGFALALCAIFGFPSALAASIPLSHRPSTREASSRSTTDNTPAVFVADYAQRESWGILAKYQQVDVLLQGANLSPSTVNTPGGMVGSDFNTQFPAATSQQTLPLAAVSSASGSILSYRAAIEIGTPPQHLDLILDTGVADSWVATSCSDCDVDQFDSSQSNTYRGSSSDFREAYGDGYVWGKFGQDNISAAGFTASPQSFGAVNAMDVVNVPYAISGVLGFAFGTVSPSKTPPFFETLMQQASLPFPVFSLALGRGGDADDSELCLGCVNDRKYNGNLTWLPLVSHTYWTVALSGLEVGDINSMTTSLLAVFDTGSNQIHLPMAVARAFYAAIPGSQPASAYGDGFWTFPCDSRLDIMFMFTGQGFNLDPRDFNLGKVSASSTECVGAVLGLKGRDLPDNFAVIGTAFLKSWYIVFDYSTGGRVGLGSRPTA
ncbi:acid protease [Calocera viscosa TUFC12733]|uniref:Acid protease n=1 Tax=Calocera viscosa (strain TUFC12733) TaxID=1330018 RepID=A0A167PM65_CALVF|nr:acid protease [Calocera viscosa TUFC12733]